MNPEQIPLRDLHLPEAVGWWPVAPGWWLLTAILLAGLLVLAARAWRNWRHGQARRVALQELARLRQAYYAERDPVKLGASLSALLRRTMLAYAPRSEVAGLTGSAWLEWLDRGLDGRPFSAGPGRALQDLPYRRAGDIDPETLIRTVRLRLTVPLPEGS